jgi:hypothetical protein
MLPKWTCFDDGGSLGFALPRRWPRSPVEVKTD